MSEYFNDLKKVKKTIASLVTTVAVILGYLGYDVSQKNAVPVEAQYHIVYQKPDDEQVYADTVISTVPLDSRESLGKISSEYDSYKVLAIYEVHFAEVSDD